MQAPEKKQLKEQTVIWMDHAGAHDEIGKVYHEARRMGGAEQSQARRPRLHRLPQPAE